MQNPASNLTNYNMSPKNINSAFSLFTQEYSQKDTAL